MHAISIERVLQRSFTSYPVVAVGVLVAAAKEMRVLKGIEQVSGTIRVIAVAATDVLAAVKSGVAGGLCVTRFIASKVSKVMTWPFGRSISFLRPAVSYQIAVV